MPSRTQRKRWQDAKKQDIPLERALRLRLRSANSTQTSSVTCSLGKAVTRA